jgi:hypothetical protein
LERRAATGGDGRQGAELVFNEQLGLQLHVAFHIDVKVRTALDGLPAASLS